MKQNHYTGLSEQEVEESKRINGSNIITPPPSVPLWKLYLEKFQDPVIRILLVATVLSFVVAIINGEYVETIGIIFAIFLATGIGFWFESNANRKFKLLNQVSDTTAIKTIRNGHISEIPKCELVVDDIVLLDTGEEIPADILLLESISLQVNESTLTGELQIDKSAETEYLNKEATYPSNRIYRGTTIMNGHCVGKIFAVGDATEFGRVAKKATEIIDEKTPLTKQLDKLAHFISIVGFSVAGIIFAELLIRDAFTGVISWGNLFTLHTLSCILNYFMVAVTLIVVSVPEGLPMSVTLSLALSMRKMLKTGNLIRKMHACETMGAVTVICSDKTGTLTQNQMQVNQVSFPGLHGNKLENNEISILIRENISVNSTAHLDTAVSPIKTLGNPTEAAHLLWLNSMGIDYSIIREQCNVIEQVPFTTEQKLMASLVESPTLHQKRIIYIKGAPEILLARASKIYLSSTEIESIDSYKDSINKQLLEYQSLAMRTLGFAYIEADNTPIQDAVKHDLIFLGVSAISDPVRTDVPAAVHECLNAGIQVKIVTGDTSITAKEIGRSIGIWTSNDTDEQIITGEEFGNLPDSIALRRVQKLKIMCRARPTDKQRLVFLLKKGGSVVAVTGDGTNDAPALNYADVGLAMGSGTSVAKEAGDITLLNDSFSSIATAVMWGRSLYHNIQRFILFQLTINLSAMLIVMIGSMFGTTMPLTVTQMLWINLIIDTFAAAALASLPPNPAVMHETPRKSKAFIINAAMCRRILSVGLLITFVLLGLLFYYEMDDSAMNAKELTIFFTVFVMLQFWNMFNAKSFLSGGSAFRNIYKAKGFLCIMLIIPLGQFMITQYGGEVFRTVPLSGREWLTIILVTSPIFFVGEIYRYLRNIFQREK